MVPLVIGSLGGIKKSLEENIGKISGNINLHEDKHDTTRDGKQPCRKCSVKKVVRDKLAPWFGLGFQWQNYKGTKIMIFDDNNNDNHDDDNDDDNDDTVIIIIINNNNNNNNNNSFLRASHPY